MQIRNFLDLLDSVNRFLTKLCVHLFLALESYIDWTIDATFWHPLSIWNPLSRLPSYLFIVESRRLNHSNSLDTITSVEHSYESPSTPLIKPHVYYFSKKCSLVLLKLTSTLAQWHLPWINHFHKMFDMIMASLFPPTLYELLQLELLNIMQV